MVQKELPKAHIGVPTLGPRDGSFGRPGLMAAPLVELTQRLGGRIADIEAVAARGMKVLPNLITILGMGTDYNKVCALACMIKMAESGTDCREAVHALRELLASKNEYVKGYAATLLGTMKDEKSIPEIAKGLGDKSHIIRWRCADALEALGAASVPELLKALDGKNERAGREAGKILPRLANAFPGCVPADAIERISRTEREQIVRNSYGSLRME